MANIRVLYFALLREKTGKAEEVLELPEGSTAEKAYGLIQQKYTGLPKLEFLAVALNQSYAVKDSILKDGDELCFIPPVAGG